MSFPSFGPSDPSQQPVQGNQFDPQFQQSSQQFQQPQFSGYQQQQPQRQRSGLIRRPVNLVLGLIILGISLWAFIAVDFPVPDNSGSWLTELGSDPNFGTIKDAMKGELGYYLRYVGLFLGTILCLTSVMDLFGKKD